MNPYRKKVKIAFTLIDSNEKCLYIYIQHSIPIGFKFLKAVFVNFVAFNLMVEPKYEMAAPLISVPGSRFPRATLQPPRKKTTSCGVFSCCFSRRSRRPFTPINALYLIKQNHFYKVVKHNTSEEIHGDSCGTSGQSETPQGKG